jgi:hypothetical protein
MNTLYQLIAQQFFAKILSGKKLNGLGWLVTLTGVLSILFSTDFVHKLCENHVVCLDGNAAWGIVMVVIGELIKALRAATAIDHADEIAQIKQSVRQ